MKGMNALKIYLSTSTYHQERISIFKGYVRRYIWRLRGLVVVCWITDHYHPCSNLGLGKSEECFIFDFASLPLGIARPI